jgi:hypothetical protein
MRRQQWASICGSLRVALVATLCLAFVGMVFGAFDRRFDVFTFDCTPDGSDPHGCQAQFNALNFVTTNGHVICMGSDAHRAELNGNGNFLAAYYNNLSGLYGTYSGTAAADQIENYVIANFTNTGVKTTWVVINEISFSLWPNNSDYRAWLRTCMARLHGTYGHSVILFSPFGAPVANGADWQPLSGNAYIGIERYLSGATVNSHANSVSWCQSQYQDALTHYENLGVSSTKLYLSEDYAQTTSGTTYGRGGCSYAGWDNAIKARASAIHNLHPAGYVSYAWIQNAMHVSEADMVHFEQTYASKTLP